MRTCTLLTNVLEDGLTDSILSVRHNSFEYGTSAPYLERLLVENFSRVRSLEQRAILLEETIEKAEEANRRWEECRVLVDQLRHENAMLRNALEDAGINSENIPTTLPHSNGQSRDTYDDLGHDRTNGVDGHPTIVLEEAGAGSPAKKRKRRDEADVDPRLSVA
jgi:hypothetical protein